MRKYHLNNFEKEFLGTILCYIPQKNSETGEIELLNSENCVEISYKFSKISPFLWGMIYERVVGISYERLGYNVDYSGIKNGFLDQGIDLICRKQDQITSYVQCKSGQKNIGKQSIETILYKGGNFIAKVDKNRCRFVLAIDNAKIISDLNRQRFLNWNKLQSKVKLEITLLNW